MTEQPGELRREFRFQLTEVEDHLLEMGNRVLDMLAEAITALERQDEELADRVIRNDDLLDGLHHQARQRLFLLLARQAPVASDLRLLVAFTHVNMHLARMGGLCVNVAKVVGRLGDAPGDPTLMAQLQEMGQHAKSLIRRSLEVLARRDVDAARRLGELDDPLDRLNHGLFRRLVTLAAEDDTLLDWAMRMVLVARYLERLGDHAVDIGEHLIFAVTGETTLPDG